MNLEITPNMLLTQLNYTINKSSQKQIDEVIKNTINFDKFAKHILSLNDSLKHVDGYIALSNHCNKFKIKSDNLDNNILLDEFHTIIKKWSNKYKVSLETIPNKEVYYIIGVK